MLIAQYVRFERSYEHFIPGAENIYRVTLEQYLNGELQIASAENYPGVGPALLQELPEVTGFARLYNLGYKNNVIITNENAQPEPVAFKHRKFLYADSSFLPMMGYALVAGDPVTALAEPLKAVISEKYAKLYFGAENPIGQSLRLQDDDYNDELVTVTGVFKDLPLNTHLKFEVLFSYKTLYGRFEQAPERYGQSWRRKDMYTFIRVEPGTDPEMLEAKFPAIVDQYKPDLKEQNRKDLLGLQPLRDIHLMSDLAEEVEPNGDGRIVLFMSLIGLFVILIAWINYINLSTARAIERAKEVGIRKVSGALKGQLVRQFLVEATLVNLIALVLTSGHEYRSGFSSGTAWYFGAGQASLHTTASFIPCEYKPNAFLKRWRMLKNPGTQLFPATLSSTSSSMTFSTDNMRTNVNSATSSGCLHNRDHRFALTGYSETCTAGYWNGISSGMVGDEPVAARVRLPY